MKRESMETIRGPDQDPSPLARQSDVTGRVYGFSEGLEEVHVVGQGLGKKITRILPSYWAWPGDRKQAGL